MNDCQSLNVLKLAFNHSYNKKFNFSELCVAQVMPPRSLVFDIHINF